MEIRLADSAPSRRADAEYFAGTVWQDPIVEAPAPARIGAVHVSFEPGARTALAHPSAGQILHVLSSVGCVQARGGPVRQIRPGYTVWISPAKSTGMPTSGMVQLALQEAYGGVHVTWMERPPTPTMRWRRRPQAVR